VQDDPRSGQPNKMKDKCKCGQITNLGAFRSKIRCQTNSRRTEYGNLLGVAKSLGNLSLRV
jgi:hypothetical protein